MDALGKVWGISRSTIEAEAPRAESLQKTLFTA
jgi:hypothetical protein